MDAQFWINAWHEGRTAFHQQKFNETLLQFFPQLHPQKGQKVFVPLCGKTKDLIWLAEQGLQVHGVELARQAVEEFFSENQLTPEMKKHITITCGDLFAFQEKDFDFVYDRASLVALPLEMRKAYAQVITRSLRSGGKYLLVSFEYDESQMQGPPFSVTESEIHELYGKDFSIKLVETKGGEKESPRLQQVMSFKQKAFILEKK